MTDTLKDLILEVVDPYQLNTGSNWITVNFKGNIVSWICKPTIESDSVKWYSDEDVGHYEGSLPDYNRESWINPLLNYEDCIISKGELLNYWLEKSKYQQLCIILCRKFNTSIFPIRSENILSFYGISCITIDPKGVIEGWKVDPEFNSMRSNWYHSSQTSFLLGCMEEEGTWRRYVSAWDEAIFEKDELFNPNKKEIKKMNKKEQKQNEQVIRVGVPDWVDANMIRLHGQQYTEDLIKSYKVNSKKDDASCLELKLWNPQGCILMGQINKAVNLPSSRFLNPAQFEGFTMEGGLYVIPDFNGPNDAFCDAFCIRFSSAYKKEEYVRHLLENLTEAYKQSLSVGDKVQKGNVSFNVIGKTGKDEWVLQNPISKVCVIENEVEALEDYAFYYSSKTFDGATLHKWTRAAKSEQE